MLEFMDMEWKIRVYINCDPFKGSDSIHMVIPWNWLRPISCAPLWMHALLSYKPIAMYALLSNLRALLVPAPLTSMPSSHLCTPLHSLVCALSFLCTPGSFRAWPLPSMHAHFLRARPLVTSVRPLFTRVCPLFSSFHSCAPPLFYACPPLTHVRPLLWLFAPSLHPCVPLFFRARPPFTLVSTHLSVCAFLWLVHAFPSPLRTF
jgi:hypothetical protein